MKSLSLDIDPRWEVMTKQWTATSHHHDRCLKKYSHVIRRQSSNDNLHYSRVLESDLLEVCYKYKIRNTKMTMKVGEYFLRMTSPTEKLEIPYEMSPYLFRHTVDSFLGRKLPRAAAVRQKFQVNGSMGSGTHTVNDMLRLYDTDWSFYTSELQKRWPSTEGIILTELKALGRDQEGLKKTESILNEGRHPRRRTPYLPNMREQWELAVESFNNQTERCPLIFLEPIWGLKDYIHILPFCKEWILDECLDHYVIHRKAYRRYVLEDGRDKTKDFL